MPPSESGVDVSVSVDMSAVEQTLKGLEDASGRFASAFTSSMRVAVRGGRTFEETLKSLALRLSDIALQSALKPLENALGSLFQTALSGSGSSGGGLLSSLSSLIQPVAEAASGLFSGAGVVPSMARTAPGVGAPVVNVAITTPNAESFRKSQTQISTLLARSVSRGQRGL